MVVMSAIALVTVVLVSLDLGDTPAMVWHSQVSSDHQMTLDECLPLSRW